MKLAVISDSHDNLANMKLAVSSILKEDVETVIHCGDLCAPFMMGLLKEFKMPVHLVFGNVDGDKLRMSQQKPENVSIHGEFADINLNNRRVAVIHYPEIASAIALSGQYYLVCYGHNHVAKIDDVGGSLLVNPGEITDYKGKPSYAVVNLERREAQIRFLEK